MYELLCYLLLSYSTYITLPLDRIRIHVLCSVDRLEVLSEDLSIRTLLTESCRTFELPFTEFFAVTHYQNMKVGHAGESEYYVQVFRYANSKLSATHFQRVSALRRCPPRSGRRSSSWLWRGCAPATSAGTSKSPTGAPHICSQPILLTPALFQMRLQDPLPLVRLGHNPAPGDRGLQAASGHGGRVP
jgi:hypothetical protein